MPKRKGQSLAPFLFFNTFVLHFCANYYLPLLLLVKWSCPEIRPRWSRELHPCPKPTTTPPLFFIDIILFYFFLIGCGSSMLTVASYPVCSDGWSLIYPWETFQNNILCKIYRFSYKLVFSFSFFRGQCLATSFL
jgi:hypothetical protein